MNGQLPFNRLVVNLRFLVGRFELHDYGTKSVVAAHDGDAGRFDPVTVVEERLVRAMRQRKHILVDRLPRLVAESLTAR